MTAEKKKGRTTRQRTRKTRYVDRYAKRGLRQLTSAERALEEHDAIEAACSQLDPALACAVYGSLFRRGFTDRGIGAIVKAVVGWEPDEFDRLMRGEDVAAQKGGDRAEVQ